MLLDEIEPGAVRTVRVPEQLPVTHPPVSGLTSQQWLDVVLLRGSELTVTVTGLDPAASPPAIEGMRVETTAAEVEIALTAEQRDQVGLPDGDYLVRGTVVTDDGQELVQPEVRLLRVPAQWVS